MRSIVSNFTQRRDDALQSTLSVGNPVLLDSDEQLLLDLEYSAMVLPFGEYLVPVANAPWLYAHYLANKLAKGYPFAMVYWDDDKGRHVILRSVDGGADVGKLARVYGGGGHRNAAGFVIVDPGDPFAGVKCLSSRDEGVVR